MTVRKVADTERLLAQTGVSSATVTLDGKQARLLENFNRAKRKLEECIQKYSLMRSAPPSSSSGTQLRDFKTVVPPVSSNSRQPLNQQSSYDYISSLEEGKNHQQTLQDLNRVHKEMSSLQDIYYSLSETAHSQHTLLDTVSANLSRATETVSGTVRELNKAKDRLDYWTRIKVYAVTGVASIGLLVWLI